MTDLRLNLVTDQKFMRGRTLIESVEAACAGGVTLVQLREKNLDGRPFVALARAVIACARRYRVPVVINDRIDVALESGADGVHLGQSDLTPATARQILGPTALVGLSVITREHMIAANREPVDYVGAGPVFPVSLSAIKPDAAPPIGLDGLREICRLSRHLVLSIGGITPQTIASTIETGAQGAAVVSAIMNAPDPKQAAADLLAAIDRARQQP